jgi:hypothetical protein
MSFTQSLNNTLREFTPIDENSLENSKRRALVNKFAGTSSAFPHNLFA